MQAAFVALGATAKATVKATVKKEATMKIRSVILACAVLATAIGRLAPLPLRAQAGAPRYEVDTSWPKSWPQRWVIGPIGAVCDGSEEQRLPAHCASQRRQ